MMTALKKILQDPPTKIEKVIVIDMTSHVGTEGKALRVEMRRIRDPATGKTKTYDRKIADTNYVIGLLKAEGFPIKGIIFKMPFHSFNGLLDFGVIDSRSPVTEVVKSKDNKYTYFATSAGEWRLELVGTGN